MVWKVHRQASNQLETLEGQKGSNACFLEAKLLWFRSWLFKNDFNPIQLLLHEAGLNA